MYFKSSAKRRESRNCGSTFEISEEELINMIKKEIKKQEEAIKKIKGMF